MDLEPGHGTEERRPLAGVRVVGIEQAVAAPFATRQLADLGAEVIKVERPGGGDFARQYDGTVLGLSSYFVWLNRSKKSIQIDLKNREGVRLIDRLLATADVLVNNLGPGSMERIGFDEQTIRDRYPRLINCRVGGFDRYGAWGSRKAYDLIVQGETGLISITGSEGQPAKVGISVADIATGMYALTGILAALSLRDQTGVVTTVDVSVFDSLVEWMGAPMYYTAYGGSQPARTGMAHATIAPYGPYPTTGGMVILAVQNDREWASFCEFVLLDEGLIEDPRFSLNSARVEHRDELDQLIQKRTRQMSRDQLIGLLDRAGIAYGSVNSMQDLGHQLLSGDRVMDVATEAGPVRALLPPIRFSAFTPRMSPVPASGEHTVEVLSGLGIDSAEIERLRLAGVIDTRDGGIRVRDH